MKKICVIGSIFFVLKTTLKINSIKKKKANNNNKKTKWLAHEHILPPSGLWYACEPGSLEQAEKQDY